MKLQPLAFCASVCALATTAGAAEYHTVFDFDRRAAITLDFSLGGSAFFLDGNGGAYGVTVQAAGITAGTTAGNGFPFTFTTADGITFDVQFIDVVDGNVTALALIGHVPGHRDDNGALAGYFDLAAPAGSPQDSFVGVITEDTESRFVFEGLASAWGGSAPGIFTWDSPVRITATRAAPPCFTTYTSGSFEYCVSERGTLASLQAPRGTEHMDGGGEGYILCDLTAGTVYRDLGGLGEEGWLPPETSAPGRRPFVVTRTSADGAWTLRQTFTPRLRDGQVQLSMRLTNNSALARSVQLSRVFDANMDASTGGDVHDKTLDSVTARQHHGLMPTAAQGSSVHETFVEPIAALTTASCAPSSVAVPTPAQDFAGTLRHGTLTIGPGRSAVVVVRYRSF
jgi:hypothetical protein